MKYFFFTGGNYEEYNESIRLRLDYDCSWLGLLWLLNVRMNFGPMKLSCLRCQNLFLNFRKHNYDPISMVFHSTTVTSLLKLWNLENAERGKVDWNFYLPSQTRFQHFLLLLTFIFFLLFLADWMLIYIYLWNKP